MANLRRHFNFTKSSFNQEREIPFPVSSPGKTYRDFDKNHLMNDIRNCLDVCCCYIQTLNSLCGAGSSLARNLFHAVREVPVYYNVSLQFLSVWEEISKATAGASAAVKTETLMMLQEILNDLELGASETDIETTIADSFQVIGTCLCSFIELQAQFSLTTWKSLSKLSKNFTSDSVRHGLQWKSLDRNPSKISVNTDLNATIKKHFSHMFKVGQVKTNEPVVHQHCHSPSISGSRNMSAYSSFGPQAISNNTTTNSVWPTPTTIWTSSDPRTIHYSGSNGSTEQDGLNVTPNNIDLDEVINLLSCVPAQQTRNKIASQNYISLSPNNEQMYHLLPKVTVPPISRRLNSHQPWNKEYRDIFGNDSWIWRIDNMNCTGLPMDEDMLKLCNERNKDVKTQWESKEIQKWNNSTGETGSSSDDGSSANGPDTEFHPYGMNNSFGRHLMLSLSNRMQSSGESMPGGLENISESKEECAWGTHSKISTWPLKQSAFKNSDSECQERSEYPQLTSHYFTS